MDEQQTEATTATSDETGPDDSAPTPERQAELRQVYEANIAAGEPPYAGVVIGTRGELKWIIGERGWRISGQAYTRRDLPDLRNTGIVADVSNMDLFSTNLSSVSISDANFTGVDLARANLSSAIVTRSNFTDAKLTFTNLSGALITESNFTDANLTSATLTSTVIARADFTGATLTATNLSDAFVGGNFTEAGLAGVNMGGAIVAGNFAGADLTRARMDAATMLGDADEESKARFDDRTRLLDVAWNGAILALVNWDEVPRLGDEADIEGATSRKERTQAYRDAARAYYGLAKALEAQGLTDPALRYRRRQHQLERAAQLRSFNLLGWLFSSALNVVSGYGDRPLRALGVYIAVILAFAGIYFGITTPDSPIFFGGSQPLQWHEALVFSLSSFHGRGFFPSTIGLGDPVAIVAALEAVVGLFIELVLIATFTRRLFER